MAQELTKAFQESLTVSKATVPLSPYKVPAYPYWALFKSFKVEEEMIKQVGNIRPFTTDPDLHQALEKSLEDICQQGSPHL